MRYVLALLLALILAVPAFAKPVNGFTVKDGFGDFQFALADSQKKLFFQSYGDAEDKSLVFTYAPTGPAPADSLVAREEIAKAVKWLFYNEMRQVDMSKAGDLLFGITCVPTVLTSAPDDPTMNLGIRYTVEKGAIRKVEVASDGFGTCADEAAVIKQMESHNPKAKGKKK